MAAVFKNALSKDVTGNTFTTVYTAPTGKASYIIECDVACTESSGVQVSVVLVKDGSSDAVYVVKGAPVPTGSSIQVIDGQKIVLESGDSLKVKCESPGQKVDVVVSLVEDVNS